MPTLTYLKSFKEENERKRTILNKTNKQRRQTQTYFIKDGALKCNDNLTSFIYQDGGFVVVVSIAKPFAKGPS